MSILKRLQGDDLKTKKSQTPNTKSSRPVSRASAFKSTQPAYQDLKRRVQNKLIATLDPQMDIGKTKEVRSTIQELFDQLLSEENIVLSKPERVRMFDQIVAEILGFGPLQPLLEDDSITEVMVNGPKHIYVERKGKLFRVKVTFEDNSHVNRIIERIVAPLGRRIDESQPYVDARLPDGSRVNAVIPPISLVGPVLTIRKFSKIPISVSQIIEWGSITAQAVEFLKACVKAKMNVVISGGTGSGKTTLLNIVSSFIPNDERIVTIENAAELQLRQEHVITLESRPPNIEGKGAVTIRDLVINSLRMRPDRIIVGEIRGGESIDMLQAMNTGHDGSLTTAHSNSPRDTLARLETMALMAGMDLPVRVIREQVASAVDVIVHQSRMRDGTRKVVNITEVAGMEGDVITLTDIFAFEQSGYEKEKVMGVLRPTGLRPKFMDRIEAAGIHLSPQIFGIGASQRRR
ncbi:MAG: CpaF family protein [Anaerolineaceae bacterium]|nr:CpaF family protein [Anaerolineaceae bacterium]